MTAIAFDNSYARDLPETFVPWKPVPVKSPRLLFFNRELALDLGLDADALAGSEGADLFAGNAVPDGAEPLAQAYAGHQFGGFSPRLGDGRAVLLGEVIDSRGHRRDIALKGSGRTPFSRGGDGRAAVGPMLREALISEAMHALGIPTTRSLAVVATGESVIRERVLPGAVLTRVAASHLRVGTFQFFAARGEHDKLRQVADYTIARHYPELAGRPDRYLDLLAAVARRQASLIAQWMNVGFIHGVMNTDNMALSGETIDYGPCAFLEAYDPATVFSSIDGQGRYAYGNQPGIARWNLARFAETLLPLIAGTDDEAAIQQSVERVLVVIDAFPGWYEAALRAGQREKLGLLPDPAPATATATAPAAESTPPDPVAQPGQPVQPLSPLQAAPTAAEAASGDLALAAGKAINEEVAIETMMAATRDIADSGTATDPAGPAPDSIVDPEVLATLADDWLVLLHDQRVDFTLAWRRLADAAAGDAAPLRALFVEPTALDAWLTRWQAQCSALDAVASPGSEARASRMRRVNPLLIPRNHLVEEALEAASERGDLEPFAAMLAAVRRPFDDTPEVERYAQPAPAEVTATYQTFCGT